MRTPRLTYCQHPIDRLHVARKDPAYIQRAAMHEASRVLLVTSDECFMPTGNALPGISVARSAQLGILPDDCVLLGKDDERHWFASSASAAQIRALQDLDVENVWCDVRTRIAQLSPLHAGLWAFARGVMYWHERSRFCGGCASPLDSIEGGMAKRCINASCAHLFYPQISPAIIVLLESLDGQECLLARHVASTNGAFSTLAGFVEIAESLEDAVHREVFEEVRVRIENVRYQASQGWPFPAGLMLGFRATALERVVQLRDDEILETRWFTRDALRRYIAQYPLRSDSIERYLTMQWLQEAREV